MKIGDIVIHKTGAIGKVTNEPNTAFFDKFYPTEAHGILSVKVDWVTGDINTNYKHEQLETVCNDTDYYSAQIRLITDEELKSLPSEIKDLLIVPINKPKFKTIIKDNS